MKKLNNKAVAQEVKVGAAQMCGPGTNCSCNCTKCSDTQANPSKKLKKIYKG